MKFIIASLVVLLVVAHQDYWNWDNDTLVLGFLPMGLFYHICISLLAAAVWIVAVTWAWPHQALPSSLSQRDGN